MLNRLRWKFILVATGSLLAVLLAFLVLLNAGNYIISTAAADQMLTLIAKNEGDIPAYSDNAPGEMPWDYPITQETPYETRYFLILVDKELSVADIQLDFIQAVSESDAAAYFQEILQRGSTFGYIDRYRFYFSEQDDGYLLVFLDCSRQLQTMRNILLLSLGGSLLILLTTGGLIFLFSKRAILPMMENIERQKQFITDASHELRTPLTSILAACDLLQMDDPKNDLLDTIHHEATRMGGLTAELVALSRLDEACPYPEPQRFSLSDAAWDVAGAFQAAAAAAGKSLEVDIQQDVFLYGEEGAIQKVVSILLDNAVKYALPGGTIRFTLTQRRRSILLETSNPCPPLEDGQLERLFDRFYRTDRSRSRNAGGSGIGLSMAKAIVEAHGGQIRASCRQESTAVICFQVRLRPQPERKARKSGEKRA